MSQPMKVVEATLQNGITAAATLPVVIVGNGPVGMHTARELISRNPSLHIIIYGDEQQLPYNRVRLSSLLSGDINWEELLERIECNDKTKLEERFGVAVTRIDPDKNQLLDAIGCLQPYQKLVLATGSQPHIPGIPRINLPGVFTFRNLDDTTRLLARQVRSRHTIVLGGGLLGMEAARAMQRGNTKVTLIEHADRLLGHQLDENASQMLQKRVEALGIDVIIGNGVRCVTGDASVEGVELVSGETICCDTLIVATGIRPHIELARESGLVIGKGIRVNDSMQTSVPNIYAVGECAEHRDRVYGLVAPGLEQAAVAANHITGNHSYYAGSITASHLKVIDCPVFSAGPMGALEDPMYGKNYSYSLHENNIYRKIKIHRNRIIGAIGIGAWPEDNRIQQAIAKRQFIWPWQRFRFRRSGRIWPEEEQLGVSNWPAATTVCQCTGATRGTISESIRTGAACLEEITRCTGAGSVCGSCRPLLQQLLGTTTPQAAPYHKTLLLSGIFTILAMLGVLMLPTIPYASSVQLEWQWDKLWRDGLIKQISGFTVLGLFLLGLFLSPRKRLQTLQKYGKFDIWRMAHILLGLLVIIMLLGHTGGRLGSGINLLLMLGFSMTLLLGGIASGIIGLEHRIGGALATRLRRKTVWWHILAFWPVPVLLSFHILKGYWF